MLIVNLYFGNARSNEECGDLQSAAKASRNFVVSRKETRAIHVRGRQRAPGESPSPPATYKLSVAFGNVKSKTGDCSRKNVFRTSFGIDCD